MIYKEIKYSFRIKIQFCNKVIRMNEELKNKKCNET
jgi:hypothetical protein